MQGRTGIALTALVLTMCAGCASAPRHRTAGSRPLRAAASSADPSGSRNACGTARKGALTTFGSDGSQRWSIELPAGKDASQTAPIADHDVIYSGYAGSVSAVRASNGSIEWTDRLGSSIYTLWLTGGLVVVNVDQVSSRAELVGLDAASGAMRWKYSVGGGGFLGNAALTDDGGLAFRVGDTGELTMLDVSSGHVRWSEHVGQGRSDGPDLPTAAPGLVLYADELGTVYALDSRTGEQRWQVRGGVAGPIVVSDGAAVVEPDATSGSTVTVVAHALDDGREVWRRELSDISAVYADADGFLLMDYRSDVVTLVRAGSGKEIWHAALSKIDNLEQAPIGLTPDGAIAVVEHSAVAFIDRATGAVHQVPAPRGIGRAVGPNNTLFVTNGEHVQRITANGVSWTAGLPHFTQSDPAALDDGAVAVQSEDLECAFTD